jgi:Holliday junction resolvase-like predicted endonuclease
MLNKQTEIDFSKQLIKGRICEQVFNRMFIKEEKYTVIPFGYENIVPEIMQYANSANNYGLLDNVRNAPDFALISHEKNEVFLVEVKYRSYIQEDKLKDIAEKIQDKWKQAILFLATPQGFYFDLCSDIIVNDGKIRPLGKNWVSEEIQEEYLKLLKEFIS